MTYSHLLRKLEYKLLTPIVLLNYQQQKNVGGKL